MTTPDEKKPEKVEATMELRMAFNRMERACSESPYRPDTAKPYGGFHKSKFASDAAVIFRAYKIIRNSWDKARHLHLLTSLFENAEIRRAIQFNVPHALEMLEGLLMLDKWADLSDTDSGDMREKVARTKAEKDEDFIEAFEPRDKKRDDVPAEVAHDIKLKMGKVVLEPIEIDYKALEEAVARGFLLPDSVIKAGE